MNEYDLAVALKDEYLMLRAKERGAKEALEIQCRTMARKIFHQAGISNGGLFSIDFNTGVRHFQFWSFDLFYYDEMEIWVIARSVNVDGRLSKFGNQRTHCIWKGQVPKTLPAFVKPSNIKIRGRNE